MQTNDGFGFEAILPLLEPQIFLHDQVVVLQDLTALRGNIKKKPSASGYDSSVWASCVFSNIFPMLTEIVDSKDCTEQDEDIVFQLKNAEIHTELCLT